jgi:hypothetical protein
MEVSVPIELILLLLDEIGEVSRFKAFGKCGNARLFPPICLTTASFFTAGKALSSPKN